MVTSYTCLLGVMWGRQYSRRQRHQEEASTGGQGAKGQEVTEGPYV
jgi:hypothetical protein